MFARTLVLSFLLITGSYATITHTVIPSIDLIEDSRLEKFSDSYIQEVAHILENKTEKIRVVTYNILFDLFDDHLEDKSLSWANRSTYIVKSIENMKPDLLCVQETYPNQLLDLQRSLNPTYSCFVGESTTGELNAIFYKNSRFELDLKNYGEGLSSASLNLPLNDKDEVLVARVKGFLPPELEPGRQLTLAHFHDKLTGKEFVVLNTHLSYHRVNSREDQAKFMIDLANKLHALNKIVIATGDLNTLPNRPERADYGFYDGDHICMLFKRELQDTRDVALLGHVGPLCTAIRDFLKRGDKPFDIAENPGLILDHIYVSPQVAVIVNAIEPCLVDNHFPSDHFPVIADIILP